MSGQCRICRDELNINVFSAQLMPLTDDFVKTPFSGKSEFLKDIDIYACGSCHIVQNPDDFDHDEYYRDYQYSSGHSPFVKQFMRAYAKEAALEFERLNGRTIRSVVEVGSGDGEQLECFRHYGAEHLVGIEPSQYLAEQAEKIGIKTRVGLFDHEIISDLRSAVDICISSFTFDHVRDPLDYLSCAHEILTTDGVLALEIHDLDKIVERGEYCLFEHEHTIYLNRRDLEHILERSGFSVIAINPLKSDVVRGNSLIVLAQKAVRPDIATFARDGKPDPRILGVKHKVNDVILRLDSWLQKLPADQQVEGFGAGGRGVMTLAALNNYGRFSAVFDSNFPSDEFLLPKSRLPILGPADWAGFADANCLVFSFGYFSEIRQRLLSMGFSAEKIFSLLDFYEK